MLGSGIDTKTYLLLVGGTIVIELDGKRLESDNMCHAVTQKPSYLAMPFGRHNRLPFFVKNVNHNFLSFFIC